MIKEISLQLFDLVMCLSKALDLVDPVLVNHHKRVAYIAGAIAGEMGFSRSEQTQITLAGLVHDAGAISLKERLDLLAFEGTNPHMHARRGSFMLRGFKPFAHIADMVEFHHVFWENGKGIHFNGKDVPHGARVLCLSDYIAIVAGDGNDIFAKRNEIIESVKEKSGDKYDPKIIEAFLVLAQKEYFWLDLISNDLGQIISNASSHDPLELDLTSLLELGKVFSYIIDFRSRFTATHTSGVAASSKALARFMGFSERECRSMHFAGLIHDLGKLAVPNEILEKPGKLTIEEFNIIKSHTYHTYRVLENLPNFETLASWGAFHHERLNGKGYPFKHSKKDLSLGSRIMAVADVFTALTEDRPYRAGMDKDKTLNTIKKMAESGALDIYVVKGLEKNYAELNEIRKTAQENAFNAFLEFEKSCLDNRNFTD